MTTMKKPSVLVAAANDATGVDTNRKENGGSGYLELQRRYFT